MTDTNQEFKKLLGFMGTLRYNKKVKSLRKQIKGLWNNQKVQDLENAIITHGLIDSIGDLNLYFDHIEKSNRKIKFTLPLDVQIQTGGDVYTTSRTSGGGSHLSLSRTVMGGLLLGPVGAVAGAMTQKHGKIDTQTTVHDDRKIIINISGDGGFITETLPYTDESESRTFMEKVLNISYDYRSQKAKPTMAEYMAGLDKKLSKLIDSLGINSKEKELKILQQERQDLKNKWEEYKIDERKAKKDRQQKFRELKKEENNLKIENIRKDTEKRLVVGKEQKNLKKDQSHKARKEKLQNISKSLLVLKSKLGIFKKWYARKPVIIIFLIIFFPIGLPLMWKFTSWSKKTKLIITGIIALIVALIFIGTYNSTPIINVDNAKENRINTNSRTYNLTGEVSSLKKVTLTINGQPVALSDRHKFLFNTTLNEGDNTINLIATNDNGETKEVIIIQYTAMPIDIYK